MELERCAIESGEKSELPAGSPLTGETRPGGIPSSPLGFRLSARPAPAAISARPPRSSSSDTHLESAIPCSAAGPPGADVPHVAGRRFSFQNKLCFGIPHPNEMLFVFDWCS